MLATIAAITIIVGNVGALGQSSMKRMLGYSGVAQAGYMLAGVVVGTQLGVEATVLYLCVYLVMNMAAFAVIVAQERDGQGDDIAGLAGLGASRPWLAVADHDRHARPGRDPGHGRLHRQVPAHPRARRRRLHLVGDRARDRLDDLARLLPARRGDDVDDVARSAPTPAGACIGPDRRRLARGRRARARATGATVGARARFGQPEVVFVAGLFAAASIFFGIFPSPLFNLAAHAGNAFTGLF